MNLKLTQIEIFRILEKPRIFELKIALLILMVTAISLPAAIAFEADVEPVVSKNQAYPQEPIFLEYRVYVRVDGRIEGFEVEPRTPYFWREDFPMDQKEDLKLKMTFWKSEKAALLTYKKMVLYGMQPGQYAIHPGTLQIALKNRAGEMAPHFIKTRPIEIQLFDFPKEGQPEDFNGFAGDFKLTSQAEVFQSPEGGEYIQLTLLIAGKGNIRQIPQPRIKIADDLLLADVFEDAQVVFENQQIAGTKIFRLKLLPKRTGHFKIPPAHFSFFNSSLKQYVSAASEELEISISRTSANTVKSAQVPSLIIALDHSGSMLAQDVQPDRMGFAKKFIKIVLTSPNMKDTVSSLFAFSKYTRRIWESKEGDGFDELLNAVPVVEQQQLDGTAIGSVLYEAGKVFEKGAGAGACKSILLLTDGKSNSGYIDPLTAAYFLKDKGVKVFTIGIGRKGKADFPVIDPAAGRKIVPTDVGFDADTLKQISEITGGKFFVLEGEENFQQVSQELVKGILE